MQQIDIIPHSLGLIGRGQSLSVEESEQIFDLVAQGGLSPARVGALLMGLRQKGESGDEMTGAVRALRRHARPAPALPADLVAGDVCGTGGDGQHSLNVSTAVALTLAGCGVAVAKHGNRAASSKCGTADVLEYLGVAIDRPPEQAVAGLVTHSLCFLMAPVWHPALAPLAPIRRELGFRTIFNLLGPLLNPLPLTWQMIGVFDAQWLAIMAQTAHRLGVTRCWAVHGHDGLDELSITGLSQIVACHDGVLKSWTITPEDAGLTRGDMAGLRGGDVAFNARALLGLLAGAPGAYRDIVLLNSAAGLMLAEHAHSLSEGVARAAHALDSGAAKNALDCLIAKN